MRQRAPASAKEIGFREKPNARGKEISKPLFGSVFTIAYDIFLASISMTAICKPAIMCFYFKDFMFFIKVFHKVF